jgi:plastocyanin
MVPKGGTFILRFDRPGIWAYHCTPHPFMRGVIVVR